jgi:ribonuclease HI
VLVVGPMLALAIVVLSVVVGPGTRVIGILILATGLALLLPVESLKGVLYSSGVARHRLGDPTGPAGVGGVLRSVSGEVMGEVERSIGVTTNTVADYVALIDGLTLALNKGVREVQVYVDSPVVIGHLLHGYRIRADHLRPLVEQVRQLLDQFAAWSMSRVPRELNLESTLLANRGIELDQDANDLRIAETHVVA